MWKLKFIFEFTISVTFSEVQPIMAAPAIELQEKI